MGLMVTELADPKVVATAQGVCGLAAGLGSAIAGYPFSKLITHGGWLALLGTEFVLVLLTLLLLVPLIHVTPSTENCTGRLQPRSEKSCVSSMSQV
jgi:sugar phosphate permease